MTIFAKAKCISHCAIALKAALLVLRPNAISCYSLLIWGGFERRTAAASNLCDSAWSSVMTIAHACVHSLSKPLVV